jgi:hypothetical protein
MRRSFIKAVMLLLLLLLPRRFHADIKRRRKFILFDVANLPNCMVFSASFLCIMRWWKWLGCGGGMGI